MIDGLQARKEGAPRGAFFLARALGAPETAWQATGQFRQVLWAPEPGSTLGHWLLGVSLLESGAQAHRFALPAHALCVCSWVLQGSMAVIEGQDLTSPLGPVFGGGPASQPTSLLAAPGTRVLGLLLPARVLPLATGLDAAQGRDRALSPQERAGLLLAIQHVARRCLPGGLPGDESGDEEPLFAARFAALSAELPAAQRLLRALADHERVQTALDASGLTPRQAQRLCRRHFGLPPVALERLFRLHRCASQQLAERGPAADAALAAGYCDQAHMARDFRTLADVPPRALADEQRSWALRAGATVLAPGYLGRS